MGGSRVVCYCALKSLSPGPSINYNYAFTNGGKSMVIFLNNLQVYKLSFSELLNIVINFVLTLMIKYYQIIPCSCCNTPWQ